MPRRALIRLVIFAALIVIGYLGYGQRGHDGSGQNSDAAGEARILEAYAKHVSGLWVQSEGIVDRKLPDDNQGSRHQRFILELPSGHSLLVSHNIDLAPRLDGLDRGDRVAFRGEYEWNQQGGIVHWTHHDPRGRIEGGWLEWQDRRYD